MSAQQRQTLIEIYRREMLSFLQYVGQATPYAGRADRPLAERVLELARMEARNLEGFADKLDKQRITLPYLGAFPSAFTNYNFIAVRKLLPHLVTDQQRGLAALEHDLNALPSSDARTWVERLADAKRLHLTELEKLTA